MSFYNTNHDHVVNNRENNNLIDGGSNNIRNNNSYINICKNNNSLKEFLFQSLQIYYQIILKSISTVYKRIKTINIASDILFSKHPYREDRASIKLDNRYEITNNPNKSVYLSEDSHDNKISLIENLINYLFFLLILINSLLSSKYILDIYRYFSSNDNLIDGINRNIFTIDKDINGISSSTGTLPVFYILNNCYLVILVIIIFLLIYSNININRKYLNDCNFKKRRFTSLIATSFVLQIINISTNSSFLSNTVISLYKAVLLFISLFLYILIHRGIKVYIFNNNSDNLNIINDNTAYNNDNYNDKELNNNKIYNSFNRTMYIILLNFSCLIDCTDIVTIAVLCIFYIYSTNSLINNEVQNKHSILTNNKFNSNISNSLENEINSLKEAKETKNKASTLTKQSLDIFSFCITKSRITREFKNNFSSRELMIVSSAQLEYINFQRFQRNHKIRYTVKNYSYSITNNNYVLSPKNMNSNENNNNNNFSDSENNSSCYSNPSKSVTMNKSYKDIIITNNNEDVSNNNNLDSKKKTKLTNIFGFSPTKTRMFLSNPVKSKSEYNYEKLESKDSNNEDFTNISDQDNNNNSNSNTNRKENNYKSNIKNFLNIKTSSSFLNSNISSPLINNKTKEEPLTLTYEIPQLSYNDTDNKVNKRQSELLYALNNTDINSSSEKNNSCVIKNNDRDSLKTNGLLTNKTENEKVKRNSFNNTNIEMNNNSFSNHTPTLSYNGIPVSNKESKSSISNWSNNKTLMNKCNISNINNTSREKHKKINSHYDLSYNRMNSCENKNKDNNNSNNIFPYKKYNYSHNSIKRETRKFSGTVQKSNFPVFSNTLRKNNSDHNCNCNCHKNMTFTKANQVAFSNSPSYNTIKKKFISMRSKYIQEKVKSKVIIDKLAHELKTPINSIKNYSLNISSMFNSEEEFLSNFYNSFIKLKNDISDLTALCSYTTYITSNILSLSKDYNYTVKKTKMNISNLLDEMFQVLQVLKSFYFNHENIELEMLVCENIDNYELVSDEKILTEILINIISNAVKYTKAGGITIIANVEFNEEKMESELTISVKDTGIGMSSEIKKELLETDYNNEIINLNNKKTVKNDSNDRSYTKKDVNTKIKDHNKQQRSNSFGLSNNNCVNYNIISQNSISHVSNNNIKFNTDLASSIQKRSSNVFSYNDSNNNRTPNYSQSYNDSHIYGQNNNLNMKSRFNSSQDTNFLNHNHNNDNKDRSKRPSYYNFSFNGVSSQNYDAIYSIGNNDCDKIKIRNKSRNMTTPCNYTSIVTDYKKISNNTDNLKNLRSISKLDIFGIEKNHHSKKVKFHTTCFKLRKKIDSEYSKNNSSRNNSSQNNNYFNNNTHDESVVDQNVNNMDNNKRNNNMNNSFTSEYSNNWSFLSIKSTNNDLIKINSSLNPNNDITNQKNSVGAPNVATHEYLSLKIGLKKSIKEASLLGCHLEIISEENSGTEITIKFPTGSVECIRSESKISTVKDDNINLFTLKHLITKLDDNSRSSLTHNDYSNNFNSSNLSTISNNINTNINDNKKAKSFSDNTININNIKSSRSNNSNKGNNTSKKHSLMIIRKKTSNNNDITNLNDYFSNYTNKKNSNMSNEANNTYFYGDELEQTNQSNKAIILKDTTQNHSKLSQINKLFKTTNIVITSSKSANKLISIKRSKTKEKDLRSDSKSKNLNLIEKLQSSKSTLPLIRRNKKNKTKRILDSIASINEDSKNYIHNNTSRDNRKKNSNISKSFEYKDIKHPNTKKNNTSIQNSSRKYSTHRYNSIKQTRSNIMIKKNTTINNTITNSFIVSNNININNNNKVTSFRSKFKTLYNNMLNENNIIVRNKEIKSKSCLNEDIEETQRQNYNNNANYTNDCFYFSNIVDDKSTNSNLKQGKNYKSISPKYQVRKGFKRMTIRENDNMCFSRNNNNFNNNTIYNTLSNKTKTSSLDSSKDKTLINNYNITNYNNTSEQKYQEESKMNDTFISQNIEKVNNCMNSLVEDKNVVFDFNENSSFSNKEDSLANSQILENLDFNDLNIKAKVMNNDGLAFENKKLNNKNSIFGFESNNESMSNDVVSIKNANAMHDKDFKLNSSNINKEGNDDNSLFVNDISYECKKTDSNKDEKNNGKYNDNSINYSPIHKETDSKEESPINNDDVYYKNETDSNENDNYYINMPNNTYFKGKLNLKYINNLHSIENIQEVSNDRSSDWTNSFIDKRFSTKYLKKATSSIYKRSDNNIKNYFNEALSKDNSPNYEGKTNKIPTKSSLFNLKYGSGNNIQSVTSGSNNNLHHQPRSNTCLESKKINLESTKNQKYIKPEVSNIRKMSLNFKKKNTKKISLDKEDLLNKGSNTALENYNRDKSKEYMFDKDAFKSLTSTTQNNLIKSNNSLINSKLVNLNSNIDFKNKEILDNLNEKNKTRVRRIFFDDVKESSSKLVLSPNTNTEEVQVIQQSQIKRIKTINSESNYDYDDKKIKSNDKLVDTLNNNAIFEKRFSFKKDLSMSSSKSSIDEDDYEDNSNDGNEIRVYNKNDIDNRKNSFLNFENNIKKYNTTKFNDLDKEIIELKKNIEVISKTQPKRKSRKVYFNSIIQKTENLQLNNTSETGNNITDEIEVNNVFERKTNLSLPKKVSSKTLGVVSNNAIIKHLTPEIKAKNIDILINSNYNSISLNVLKLLNSNNINFSNNTNMEFKLNNKLSTKKLDTQKLKFKFRSSEEIPDKKEIRKCFGRLLMPKFFIRNYIENDTNSEYKEKNLEKDVDFKNTKIDTSYHIPNMSSLIHDNRDTNKFQSDKVKNKDSSSYAVPGIVITQINDQKDDNNSAFSNINTSSNNFNNNNDSIGDKYKTKEPSNYRTKQMEILLKSNIALNKINTNSLNLTNKNENSNQSTPFNNINNKLSLILNSRSTKTVNTGETRKTNTKRLSTNNVLSHNYSNFSISKDTNSNKDNCKLIDADSNIESYSLNKYNLSYNRSLTTTPDNFIKPKEILLKHSNTSSSKNILNEINSSTIAINNDFKFNNQVNNYNIRKSDQTVNIYSNTSSYSNLNAIPIPNNTTANKLLKLNTYNNTNNTNNTNNNYNSSITNINNNYLNIQNKVKDLGNSTLLTIGSYSDNRKRKALRFNTVRNSANQAKEVKLKLSNQINPEKVVEFVIIDDNLLMRNTLKKNINDITKNLGMSANIREGKDGVDLLKIIIDNQSEETKIALILCDESMDYINGSTAMTLLKTLESMRKIKTLPPKICVTAFQDEDTVRQIRESGFDLIMDKNPKKQQIISILTDLEVFN